MLKWKNYKLTVCLSPIRDADHIYCCRVYVVVKKTENSMSTTPGLDRFRNFPTEGTNSPRLKSKMVSLVRGNNEHDRFE